MLKVYRKSDCNVENLRGKTFAIINFGSQWGAQALNLRDNGISVIIDSHSGSKSIEKALDAGFKVISTANASRMVDIIAILAPDELQADIYKTDIEPNLDCSKDIAFVHGFNIRYGRIKPTGNVNVFMIAPKGHGRMLC
ncbi:MAG: hypothetical protein ACRC4L_03410 [Mycoplasma sp.]